jgi:Effector-associated domain 7
MDRNSLFDALSDHFDTNEVENLCFQLGIDYDDLGGSSKSGKARELIELLNRSNRIHELADLVLRERPHLANELAATKKSQTAHSLPNVPPAPLSTATKLAIIGSVCVILVSLVVVGLWLSRPRETSSRTLPVTASVPMPTDTLMPATATGQTSAVVTPQTGTPTTAPPLATQTPSPRCDESTWFFEPHPELKLQNFRATQVTIQYFQGGARMVWIREQDQTWVLFADRSWTNQSGDLEVVYAQVAARVGIALGAPLTYQALMGNSVTGDTITAYVSDPARAVMQWSMNANTNAPGRWKLVEQAVLRDCPQGLVQPSIGHGLQRQIAGGD